MQVYKTYKSVATWIKKKLGITDSYYLEVPGNPNSVAGNYNSAFGRGATFDPAVYVCSDLAVNSTFTANAQWGSNFGGYGNLNDANFGLMLGGNANIVRGDYGVVIGGGDNQINLPSGNSTIINGSGNRTQGNYNFSTGYQNLLKVKGDDPFNNGLNFVGGCFHDIEGFGNIVGGTGALIKGGFVGVVGQAPKEVVNNAVQNEPKSIRFVVGNGTINQNTFTPVTRSNAVEVYQDGSMLLPSSVVADILDPGADPKTVLTKEYISSLPKGVYADNASAIAGGLVAGEYYRKATGEMMIVF